MPIQMKKPTVLPRWVIRDVLNPSWHRDSEGIRSGDGYRDRHRWHCWKCQVQLRHYVEFQAELAINYCKLVVVSVDQFPFEYLMRMRANFAEDGFFRAVWSRGAAFTACHHGHAFTITAPGHSVMLSGAYPSTTGIVGSTRCSTFCEFSVVNSSSKPVGSI